MSILMTMCQDPNRPSVITTARRDREQEDKENKGHKREMTIVEGETDYLRCIGWSGDVVRWWVELREQRA